MTKSGADFIALTRIYMPEGTRMVLVADVGQSCARVPSESLEHLGSRGKIKEVEHRAPVQVKSVDPPKHPSKIKRTARKKGRA